MFKRFKVWWMRHVWDLPPLKRNGKSQYDAWFLNEGGWVFIPKGTKFIYGVEVSKDARPD